MDLGGWLRSLGLEKYEAVLRDSEIDEAVLHNLTEDHLRELGFPLGARLKLLNAIATLGSPNPAAPTPVKLSPTPSAPLRGSATTEAPEAAAERRQVTVMFSDLVGSTALSARMDPEDLREVISAYQKCVAETVQRFGGFVAKYMGDGVLVYFGYPQAHEDDAERAVRAGLELVSAVSALKASVSLQSRIGIATGLVVVGDLIGAGEAQERGIVGETPNLAARLQSIAEPNMVVIAESTRKLLGNLFELEDLGASELKGIADRVRAWAALRPSSVESRFEALHASGLTELVGREEEIELLLRRWSKAKTGEGQVVLLSGEAGIGKSRLTAAVTERLAGEPHTRLRYFCSPQHTDSAFYPIISQMERAAGLVHDDTAQVKLDKLDALLAQTSTSTQDAALFAEMLSFPNDGRYPALDLAPEQRRQRILEALISQVQALARSKSVLMIFEDAHWADPTSLEAFSRVVDRLRNLRVLLIVTFRLEFEPPWIGRPYVTALTLNRLAQRDIETVIDNVVGNNLIPASIRQDIIERTDGIPLFVEEMTKAVLEAGSEGAAQQKTVASFPSPALAVPASLQASLMARLDRLGAAKEVAQIGAAIGREFSDALLAAVVHKPETELGAALDRLMAAGLLFRQGVPPYASYLFKHALVRDAAYGTLLREPKRALHARIAEALESQFAEIAQNQPELLARHCTEANLIEKAVGFWGKAGQRSLERSAMVEAVEQFTRALDQMASLPGTPKLRGQQMRLQVALANALMHVKGHAAPETKASLDHASVMIEQADASGEHLEDPLLLFSALHGRYVANLTSFNGDVCARLAQNLLALATKRGGTAALMMAHNALGSSSLYRGDITHAREHLDQSIALYDPAAHGSLATRFSGVDFSVASFTYRSTALWLLGYPDAALVDAGKALKDAREIGHIVTLMHALLHSFTWVHCGKYEVASAQADELIALADEKSTPFWKAAGTASKGQVFAATGKALDAIDIMASGRTIWRSTGATLFAPLGLSFFARAYAELGQFEFAWRSIGQAIKVVETAKERWSEAEVHRIAGEITLNSPKPDAAKAEAYFQRALDVARQQEAKSWELRAAMSMARLWRDQGKRDDEARDLLAPVYGWFTEGFDTHDLKEAKALLDELVA